MNDTDVRDILTRALPDLAVPGRITRETAVAAGRLAARRRRSQMAAAIVGACCLVVIVGATTSLHTGRGAGGSTVDGTVGIPPARTSPATATAAPTPSASPRPPGASLGPVTEPPPATATASALLRAAAQSILADATFIPTSVGFADGPRTLAPFVIYPNDHGYFIAVAAVARPSTDGLFMMTMFANGDNVKAPTPGCTPGAPSSLGCEMRAGPHGEVLTIQKGAWEGVSGVVAYQVIVHRTDGVILSGSITNTMSTNPSYEFRTSAVPNQEPPMSTDQLLELLLTPGLNPPAATG